jgi:hypothetical protein
MKNIGETNDQQNLSQKKNTFVIRESKRYMLKGTIISSCVLVFFVYLLYTEQKPKTLFEYSLPILMSLVVIAFFIKFLIPKIIVKIDDGGIWTKRHGFLEWKKINYFYTEIRHYRYGINIMLFIKLHNSKNEIFESFGGAGLSSDKTIRQQINFFKGDHKVIDMGKHRIN